MHGTAEETLRVRRSRFSAKAMGRIGIAWCVKQRAQIISFAVLFLIAIARCFELPSPYAVCCVGAMAYGGLPLSGALLGATAASFYKLLFGQNPDFSQALACLMMLPILSLRLKSQRTLIVYVCLTLIIRGAVVVIEDFTTQRLVMAAMSVALGGITLPSAVKAVKLIAERRKELSIDDLTCLILPSLMALSGLSALRIFALNPGYAASFLLVLVSAYLFGSPIAACAGAAAGFSLMLAGHGALLPVLLTLGGACCGLFRGRKRMYSFLLLILECMLLMYLLLGGMAWTVVVSAGCAGIAFLLLPKHLIKRIKRATGLLLQPTPGDNAYMKLRVKQWAAEIERMIDALPEPSIPEPDVENLCEELAGELCEGCDRMTICWHEEYEKSKRSAMRVIEASGDDERLIECVNSYYGACKRIADIPPIAARFEQERQSRLKRTLNAGNERRMLSTHLSAMSEAVQLIALEDDAETSEEAGEWLAAVNDALQAMRFPAKVRFIRQIDGRFFVCLDAEPLAPHMCAGDELSHAISIRLGASMEISERRGAQILLTQQPPMTLRMGMATSCAVTPERRNLTYNVQNGDAVLQCDLQDGRALAALSDGMGHGEDAKKESRKTLELLADCLRAGYSRTQAMTAVNGMMLSATGGEQFATVDLCLFDRWTGETTLDKLGACASYIIRGQKVQVVEGAALPLGVVAHVIPTEYAFSLSEGDTMILMSDGAADIFENEAEWTNALGRYLNESPQQIADAVLQDALVRVSGMPEDDMTVVCLRIEGQKVLSKE